MMKSILLCIGLVLLIVNINGQSSSNSESSPLTTMFGLSFGNYSSFEIDMSTGDYIFIDTIEVYPLQNNRLAYMLLLVTGYSPDNNTLSLFYLENGYFRNGLYYIDNSTIETQSKILYGKQLGDFSITADGYDPVENKIYGTNMSPFSVLIWDLNSLDYQQYRIPKSNYTMGISALDATDKLFYSLFYQNYYQLQVFNANTAKTSTIIVTGSSLPQSQGIYMYQCMRYYNGYLYVVLLEQNDSFSKQWQSLYKINVQSGDAEFLMMSPELNAMAEFFAFFTDSNYMVMQYNIGKEAYTVVYDLTSEQLVQKLVNNYKLQSGYRYAI